MLCNPAPLLPAIAWDDCGESSEMIGVIMVSFQVDETAQCAVAVLRAQLGVEARLRRSVGGLRGGGGRALGLLDEHRVVGDNEGA